MFKKLQVFALAAVVGLAACDDSTPTGLEPESAEARSNNRGNEPAGPTITDIAVASASDETSPEFTILVAALDAAGLVDVFDGRGQYTVFAPTDAAFGRALELLGLTADELLGNTDLLRQVLGYHVAPGRRLSSDVLDSDQIRTLQGDFLFPVVNDEGAFIRDTNGATEDAQLLAPDLIDIEASNGVIHVIDEVLLFGDDRPSKGGDDDDDEGDDEGEEFEDLTIAGLVSTLAGADENAEFTILLAALQAANLVDALNDDDDELTVFAPTDAAFGRLLELLGVSAEELLGNTELLTAVLLYHVAPGELLSGDVLGSAEISTLQGGLLFPTVRDGAAYIVDGSDATSDAMLLAPDLIDIEVENGVVHVIDEVLLPGS